MMSKTTGTKPQATTRTWQSQQHHKLKWPRALARGATVAEVNAGDADMAADGFAESELYL